MQLKYNNILQNIFNKYKNIYDSIDNIDEYLYTECCSDNFYDYNISVFKNIRQNNNFKYLVITIYDNNKSKHTFIIKNIKNIRIEKLNSIL